jgi:hypothetical protein
MPVIAGKQKIERKIMEDKKAEILGRIAKLLTLSKDQADKPEGQSAKAMASKLMAKHRIAESEIDLSSKSASDIFEDEDGWEGLCDEGGKRQWVSSLAHELARTFDCTFWINPANDTIHFLGTVGDIETVLYFMDVVFGHIEREARKALPRPDQWKKRNVFGQAAEYEVSVRLEQMRKDMEKEMDKPEYSGGSSLMVTKKDLVKNTTDSIFKERGFVSGESTFVQSKDAKIINAGRKFRFCSCREKMHL